MVKEKQDWNYIKVINGNLTGGVYKVFYESENAYGIGINDTATDLVAKIDTKFTTEEEFNTCNVEKLINEPRFFENKTDT